MKRLRSQKRYAIMTNLHPGDRSLALEGPNHE